MSKQANSKKVAPKVKIAVKAAPVAKPKPAKVKIAGVGHGGVFANRDGYPNDDAPMQGPRYRPSSKDVHRTGDVPHGLSATASDYLAAVADPQDAPLTGVPTEWPLTESFKFRSYVKGNFTIGTSKVGFIQMSPKRGMSSDAATVFYSGATYALATTPATYVEAGVSSAPANAPFTVAQYGTTALLLQGRIVGAVLRIWYIGTELNLSGEVYGVRHPDNETMNQGYSAAQLGNFPGCMREPSKDKRQTYEVYYLPTKATDVEYDVPNGSNDPINMTFLVTGVAGELWAYDAYMIHEVVGQGAPSTTRTFGDPVGLTAAVESAEASNSTYVGSAKSLLTSLRNNAAAALQWMSETTGIHGRDVMRLAGSYAKAAAQRRIEELGNWRAIHPAVRPSVSASLSTIGLEASSVGDNDPEPAFSISWENILAQVAKGDLTVVCWEPVLVVARGKSKYALVALPCPPPFAAAAWKPNFTVGRSLKKAHMASAFAPPLLTAPGSTRFVDRAGMYDAFQVTTLKTSDR